MSTRPAGSDHRSGPVGGDPRSGPAAIDFRTGPADIDFRARPYVCGAIGDWDAAVLRRLVDASPGSPREVHSTSAAALWATAPAAPAVASPAAPLRAYRRPPAGLEQRPTAGSQRPTAGSQGRTAGSQGRTAGSQGTERRAAFLWGAVVDAGASGRADSWRSAARDRLAAGLEIGEHDALLHTCALGVQDLYLRRHRGALYFAGRIDPLLAIDDAPLHADWAAWASVLALTGPAGAATPFVEVRRMTGATAWRYDAAGPAAASGDRGRLTEERFEPPWLAAEPDPAVGPADVLDAIMDAVAGRSSPGLWRPATLTLSGGWDSRLLAILARRRGRVRAWTTSNDDGRDRDIAFARQVAAALRLDHRVWTPDADAWVRERGPVARRLEHQTTHHVWMMPLARLLHRERGMLLDGLAGDVLLKNLFVPDGAVEAGGSAAGLRGLLWDSLAQRRFDHHQLLAPGVGAAFERFSRADFDAATARFDGHPAAPVLSVLDTRTVRAIGPSARWLLGPETDVRLPFLHPGVIDVSLRVSLADKAGGGFYRRLLDAADPRVAALPSTNDRGPRGARGPRRQAGAAALRAVAECVLAQEGTRALLAPEVRRALKDPAGRALVARGGNGLRLLHWAGLLADWQAAYAGRLASTRFVDPG